MDKDELHREGKDKEIQIEETQGASLGGKAIGCLVILAFVFLISAFIYENFINCGCTPAYCSRSEQDAKNVLAALASYFSEPENMRIPTVEVLIFDRDLGLNNPVENVILFPEPGELAQSQPISVMVIDYSERCPRNNAYIATMGSSAGYWE